ncbi:MAG: hypothetical protein AAF251_09830 [Pseudomonadota bacterium]
MSRLAAFNWVALAISFGALSACKPPPTDADMNRDLPEAAPTYASEPLPSPETEGAFWAVSPNDPNRLIYGVPGSPALLALTCLSESAIPRLRITRMSPADEDAGALLAMVGNGHIGRVEVDAVEVNGRFVWQGEKLAADEKWEPLAGPRSYTVTVPGAGMVTVNEGEVAMAFLEECRSR